MPDISTYNFDLQAVTALLVKAAELHEGLWMLNVGMNFTAGNFQTAPDAAQPGSMVSLSNFGLSRVEPASSPPNLTVDAALVNPKPKKKHVSVSNE
jgi:hypothetical protein